MLSSAWRKRPPARVVDVARWSPDTRAWVIICLAVALANLPTLLGFFHPDPLNARSELATTITPGLIGGRSTIDPSNGYNSQALGHLAALDLLHLRLPWWNPYEGTGMPLLGETESAALFPPTLLTALPNGQLFEHLGLEMLAGVCTYWLVRRLGVRRAAALAGGVAFALSGKFAWFADATVNPLAFLPMLLLGVEHAYAAARDGRRLGWRLIALAGALTAYAGFPEVAYIDVLLVIVWAGWRGACLTGHARLRYAVRLSCGAAVAVLLAAPMLLAMAEDLGHADLASHTGAALGTRHLPLSELPQLLMPYVFGPLNGAPRSPVWLMVGGYLSTTLLLLAVVSLLSPRHRGLKIVLMVWVGLVLAHIYGEPALLGHILDVLPGMSRIQFYRYATSALELGMIVLATLGLDDLMHAPARRRVALGGVVLGCGGVLVGGLAARHTLLTLPLAPGTRNTFLLASIAWGLLSAITVGGAGLLSSAGWRRALLVALVVVDAVVLFAVPEFSAPRATRVDLAPVTYLQRHLGESRFFTLGPIQPNYGSYFQIASLRLDDFPPLEYARFIHARVDRFDHFVSFAVHGQPSEKEEMVRHLPALRSAAVSYVVAHPGGILPRAPRALRLVFRSPTAWIYRLAHGAPFFSAAGCRVASTQLDSARVVCAHAATLVRRETWYAGWTAQVDGHSVPVGRRDGLFQTVRVPAGADTVTFRFLPVGMDWALIAMLLGCALTVTASVPEAVRSANRRRARAQVSSTARPAAGAR